MKTKSNTMTLDTAKLENSGCGFIKLDSYTTENENSALTRVSGRIENESMNTLFNDIKTIEVVNARDRASSGTLGAAQIYSEHSGRRICQITPRLRMDIIKNGEDLHAWNLMKRAVLKIAEQCSHAFGREYQAIGPTLIRSLRFCPQQLLHCDIDPHKVSNTAPKLSLLIFLHTPGALVVYEGGHRLVRNDGAIDRTDVCRIAKYLSFTAGQMIVFRQDLPHRGAASSELNERLFFELIPKRNHYKPGTKIRMQMAIEDDGETFHVDLI